MMPKLSNVVLLAISIFGIFGVAKSALAVPSVGGVSGAVTHGSNITISGSGFETKTQATPYIWDDCSGTNPNDKWDFVYPFNNDPSFRLTYRTPSQVTKANGQTGGEPLPHNHITRYFAGAHYNSGPLDVHSGLDVCAGKNDQQDYTYTYISYYVRADSDWNLVSGDGFNDHNYKEYDYAAGNGYMGDTGNYYFGIHGFENSDGDWGANYPEFNIDMTKLRVDRSLMTYYDAVEMPPPQIPTYMVYSKVSGPSPLCGWQKIELVTKHNSSDGFNRFYINNKLVWEVYLDDDPGMAPPERSETVFGGYARDCGSAEEYKNNWRYYADVYYDHSLARVMLANNQDYNQATVIEPQIPSNWADGSISAKVNLGKLPDSGTAYLFVFDTGNNHNLAGYPVTLGSVSLTDFSGTPAAGSTPLTVTFADQSTSNPTSWYWDFGDGNTSALQNPVHTYKTVNNFTVSLTATGTGGAVTTTKNNYIGVGACSNGAIRIGGTSDYFTTIQAAYNTRTNGDMVQLQAMDFNEDLELSHPVTLTLQGGFGCDYSANPGFASITGKMAINYGTITLDRLILH